jgi:hypothetical protein
MVVIIRYAMDDCATVKTNPEAQPYAKLIVPTGRGGWRANFRAAKAGRAAALICVKALCRRYLKLQPPAELATPAGRVSLFSLTPVATSPAPVALGASLFPVGYRTPYSRALSYPQTSLVFPVGLIFVNSRACATIAVNATCLLGERGAGMGSAIAGGLPRSPRRVRYTTDARLARKRVVRCRTC